MTSTSTSVLTDQTGIVQWQRVKRFNAPIWTVLIGTLLARTTYFMAWPFLVFLLYQKFGASPLEIGFMLASTAVVGSITGIYSGYLSDKFGRKWIILTGCLIASLSYSGIGLAEEIWQFFVLILLCGLMRPMIEAPTKAVISDNLEDHKDRELALNLRYFMVNVGGAVGPLLGMTIALGHPQPMFLITGAAYLLFGVAFWYCFLRCPEQKEHLEEQVTQFSKIFQVIISDRIFTKLLIANILMMFVYGQYDSSIPQMIVRSGVEGAAALVGGLTLVNTCTIITLQFPLLQLLQRVPLYTRTQIGMAMLALAQLGFMLVPADWPVGLLIACFFLSIAEAIAWPTLSVQIDMLAPAHLRGSYFGASMFYSMGFAFAPIIGGLVLQTLGSVELFILCFVTCMVMMFLYLLASREHRQRALAEIQSSS